MGWRAEEAETTPVADDSAKADTTIAAAAQSAAETENKPTVSEEADEVSAGGDATVVATDNDDTAIEAAFVRVKVEATAETDEAINEASPLEEAADTTALEVAKDCDQTTSSGSDSSYVFVHGGGGSGADGDKFSSDADSETWQKDSESPLPDEVVTKVYDRSLSAESEEKTIVEADSSSSDAAGGGGDGGGAAVAAVATDVDQDFDSLLDDVAKLKLNESNASTPKAGDNVIDNDDVVDDDVVDDDKSDEGLVDDDPLVEQSTEISEHKVEQSKSDGEDDGDEDAIAEESAKTPPPTVNIPNLAALAAAVVAADEDSVDTDTQLR